LYATEQYVYLLGKTLSAYTWDPEGNWHYLLLTINKQQAATKIQKICYYTAWAHQYLCPGRQKCTRFPKRCPAEQAAQEGGFVALLPCSLSVRLCLHISNGHPGTTKV